VVLRRVGGRGPARSARSCSPANDLQRDRIVRHVTKPARPYDPWCPDDAISTEFVARDQRAGVGGEVVLTRRAEP
jgi:hypothetical protein